MMLILDAVIAVGLVLGAIIGIRISERNERRDADLAALVTADQFLTDMDAEAERWRWGR